MAGDLHCLSEMDRLLCAYAERVALRPADTTEADIERLRQAGLSDRAILDANLVASMFAFFVRMAEGLGVELEEIMKDPPPGYR